MRFQLVYYSCWSTTEYCRPHMTQSSPRDLGVTAWLVIICLILSLIAGAVWHGITEENLQRLWQNLVDRPSRQLSFRFVLQPAMAMLVAIRDGFIDARRHRRSPYLWSILWDWRERTQRLREGLNATARIILIAMVIDLAYQAIELKIFYPGEAPIVALLLAFIPYVLTRGLAMRVANWWTIS